MYRPPLYPLTFTPVLRDYVWGGRNLGQLYGRALPPAGPVAESWEISGHPNGPSLVDAGPWQGHSLSGVLASWGTDLVGSRASWAMKRSKFPLLVKLLDAAQNLSVQVHPGDEYAQLHEGGELGKTEMWYVLHAQPGAQVILGLQPNLSAQELVSAIAANRLEACLQCLPVEAGDAVFIPAGTLHAMLAGVMVVEVEQNSDTTYRVYDWGRLGADGRPRPLHIAKGLEVIDFQQAPPGVCRPLPLAAGNGITCHEISRCQYFVVEKLQFDPGAACAGHTDGQTLEIWGTVEGQSELSWAAGPAVLLPAIRFCLVPARLGDFGVRAKTAATMLRVYLP
jgi:mannose-6-phosphate isomerase